MNPTGVTANGAAGGRTSARRLSPIEKERLAEEQVRREEERVQRLDALGEALSKKRSDAIVGRQALGIDHQWEEDLEHYEGIDNANRGEINSWRTKPPGQLGSTDQVAKQGDVRSTVFVNITRPYCDAAAARIGDMLMPTDDRAWSIEPTPVPELADLALGKVSEAVKTSIHKQATNPEQEQSAVDQAIETAKVQVAEARKRSERAQTRIDDWHTECQYHAELRKIIDDSAKLGTGVLKGPVPVKKKAIKVMSDQDGMRIVVEQKLSPASRRIDPLNLFPDPGCGENIHNGSYVWERDYLSRKRLMDLRGTPGYIDLQIDRCLEEGPQNASGEAMYPQGMDELGLKSMFEVWYYYGLIEREDFEASGGKLDPGPDGEYPESVYAILTMVNNRVIKAALNPLDTGDFPYDVMVWQRSAGKWVGIGVARQIRTAQRIVNAATRNLMDNAGLASGVIIVMKLEAVTPADGNASLGPRKVYYLKPDVEVRDMGAVFKTYKIDMIQAELMAIIDFGMKVAEDTTGLPMLLQGQQGHAPDTLGGLQMMHNNASTVLRRLAKLFDDGITEPHVRRYYVWLMQYGDDTEKGDYQINARGSSALVERDLQNQAIMQMGQLVSNPAFKVNPAKWFEEYCKSQRLDPKRFQYTDEEWKQVQEQMQNGPADPRIAAAQIAADVKKWVTQFESQTKERLALLEQSFDREMRQYDGEMELLIKHLEQRGEKAITLDQLRAALAQTAMKVRAQRDLSAMRATTRVASPPTEPAGRAPAGQAYER